LKAEIQFINVHDGIYVADNRKDEVEMIMENVLKKELAGINSKIN